MPDDAPLIEPVYIPDVYVSGPPVIVRVEFGLSRLTFTNLHASALDGTLERPVQTKLVATLESLEEIHAAIGQYIAAMKSGRHPAHGLRVVD